jgi:hypothetical protein
MGSLSRFKPLLFLAALFGALLIQQSYASSSLGGKTIQLRDLRAGYAVARAGYRSAAAIAGRRHVPARQLIGHGWIRSYEAVYSRRDDPRVQVGNYADQFHGAAGARWWYGVSVHHLPLGYSTITLAPVGEQSIAVQSGSTATQTGYVGVIFRRSQYVVDVYVSLAAPFPYGAVLTLSREVDQRLRTATPVPTAGPKATATPVKAPGLFVHAWVSPATMLPGAYPILYARTLSGAVCTASISYSPGGYLRSFDGSARTATTGGMVSWSWHIGVKNTTGKASVACTAHGQAKSTVTLFRIRG